MSNITRAELEEMRIAAAKIVSIADQFRDEYTAMYMVIHDRLVNSWVGVDSDSFVNNVDSVRYKFDNMFDTMNDYARAILDAVERYEEQIREMEEAARRMEFESEMGNREDLI